MAMHFQCNLAAAPMPLKHTWEHTVGSGRAVLALRADWQQHLRQVRLGDLVRSMYANFGQTAGDFAS